MLAAPPAACVGKPLGNRAVYLSYPLTLEAAFSAATAAFAWAVVGSVAADTF